MSILAEDRGCRGNSFTLITPANRYRSKLPSLGEASVFKLVTPRLAPAQFAEYLIASGESPVAAEIAPGFEHFFLAQGVADSALPGATVEGPFGAWQLMENSFAYLSSDVQFSLKLEVGVELLWIKRPYVQWPGIALPDSFCGRLDDVAAVRTAVDGLTRKELIDPANCACDFNMSLMEFGPGVELAQIEIHDEEHGLYMTAGGGTYQLDGHEFEVFADDFIYMAPYCPQGFRAGPGGGSYLLYKDVFRDGF